MPGHQAKLAGFFAVLDEIYPRQVVIEQIKAVTPETKGGAMKVKQRIQSANRNGRSDPNPYAA